MGNLYLDFDLPGDERLESYYRDLRLDRALATTRFQIDDVTYTREVFASFLDQVIVVRLTASQPRMLSFSARLDSELRHSVASGRENTFVLQGQCPVHVEPSYLRNIAEPVVYDDQDGMRFEIQLLALADDGSVRVDPTRLHVSEASAVTLLISAATSYNGYDKLPGREGVDPVSIATGHLDRAANQSYSTLLVGQCQLRGMRLHSGEKRSGIVHGFRESSSLGPIIGRLFRTI